jgi:hypothetical protein
MLTIASYCAVQLHCGCLGGGGRFVPVYVRGTLKFQLPTEEVSSCQKLRGPRREEDARPVWLRLRTCFEILCGVIEKDDTALGAVCSFVQHVSL